MEERLQAIVPRTGKDGKTYFTRIGVAFPSKDGEGWSVILEALPLPDKEGRCVVLLRPPLPDKNDAPRQSRPAAAGASAAPDLDDGVPF